MEDFIISAMTNMMKVLWMRTTAHYTWSSKQVWTSTIYIAYNDVDGYNHDLHDNYNDADHEEYDNYFMGENCPMHD